MSTTIGITQITKMIMGAASEIRDNIDELSRLDAVIGDGDHGTSMNKAANAAVEIAENPGERDLKTLLYDVGWAIMCIDGGSTGPLPGPFLMGMPDAVEGVDELDARQTAAMFQAGMTKMQKQSKAKVGDKTMMDALIPAVDTVNAAADNEKDIASILNQAADAAQKGSMATKEMKAAFGRARNLGDRSIGSVDPGSVSIALIFKGFRVGFSLDKYNGSHRK